MVRGSGIHPRQSHRGKKREGVFQRVDFSRNYRSVLNGKVLHADFGGRPILEKWEARKRTAESETERRGFSRSVPGRASFSCMPVEYEEALLSR
jgi:hypothetical protein